LRSRLAAAASGVNAASNLLDSYGKRGLNTVSGIVSRWAPQADNNPTNAYAVSVARSMGVDPNAPIDLSNPQVKAALISAMSGFENGAGRGMQPQQVAQILSPQNNQPATSVAPPVQGGVPAGTMGRAEPGPSDEARASTSGSAGNVSLPCAPAPTPR